MCLSALYIEPVCYHTFTKNSMFIYVNFFKKHPASLDVILVNYHVSDTL